MSENQILLQDIEKIVDDVLKKREEAVLAQETEAALQKAAETITQLSESLEARDTEHQAAVNGYVAQLSTLETKLNDLTALIKTLEDEKANFIKDKEILQTRVEAAEGELADIKKNQIAQTRFAELKSAGVSAKDEAIQLAKVKEMTDEDFAAYKGELVNIREAIMAQMKEKPIEKVETKTESVVDVKVEKQEDSAVPSKAATEEEELEAAVDPQQPFDPKRAVAAALNMEHIPSADVLTKYRELGKTMADSIKARKK